MAMNTKVAHVDTMQDIIPSAIRQTNIMARHDWRSPRSLCDLANDSASLD